MVKSRRLYLVILQISWFGMGEGVRIGIRTEKVRFSNTLFAENSIHLIETILLGNPLDGMTTLCTIHADLSGLYPFLQRRPGKHGVVYWRVEYDILIEFGGTQLKARLQWKEGVRIFA